MLSAQHQIFRINGSPLPHSKGQQASHVGDQTHNHTNESYHGNIMRCFLHSPDHRDRIFAEYGRVERARSIASPPRPDARCSRSRLRDNYAGKRASARGRPLRRMRRAHDARVRLPRSLSARREQRFRSNDCGRIPRGIFGQGVERNTVRDNLGENLVSLIGWVIELAHFDFWASLTVSAG